MTATKTTSRTDTSTGSASDRAMESVNAALESAKSALESARDSLEEAYAGAKATGRVVADRSAEYLELAGTHLSDAKQYMGDVAARSRKRVESAYEELQEQYDELKQRASELREAAREKVAELELGRRRDEVLEYLQNNPAKSVLMALAVGFLAGYVTRAQK